jgi:hypothetical protein
MAAIALAETLTYQQGVQYADFGKVGDLTLVNATWGPSYGGWQVRSLIADQGKGTLRDATRLPEPNWNALAARQIYRDQGFPAWSTYTSGAYQGYMQDAKFNPPPSIPKGCYLVTGGDALSLIAKQARNGQKDYPWQLLAKINNIPQPGYTIFPGQVLLLPDWLYKVQSADTLSGIAAKYATVTWQRIADYNKLSNPDQLAVGQPLWIPRYTSWDGTTLLR